MRKAKTLLGWAILGLGLAGCLGAFLCSVPIYLSIVQNEIQPKSLLYPYSLAYYLPDRIDTPRYEALYRLCIRYPRGTVGISYKDYRLLTRREREFAHNLCNVAFETIVRETGQPVRFRGAPPSSMRYVIKIDAPKTGDAQSIASFRDMDMFDLENAPP